MTNICRIAEDFTIYRQYSHHTVNVLLSHTFGQNPLLEISRVKDAFSDLVNMLVSVDLSVSKRDANFANDKPGWHQGEEPETEIEIDAADLGKNGDSIQSVTERLPGGLGPSQQCSDANDFALTAGHFANNKVSATSIESALAHFMCSWSFCPRDHESTCA